LLVNVAVSDCALPLILNVQGLVVPVHVVVPPLLKDPLQPVKTESAFAPTLIVPSWLLSTAVTHGLGLPVQGGAFGSGEKLENVMFPPPVPAKVIAKFLAAATYGPTNGPPAPMGSAPAGCTGSVAVSASARAMFT